MVEAAQERLFKKVVDKFGQDALNVLESSDFGIPRRPGKLMTGPPPIGKVADGILVVGRDGKIISGEGDIFRENRLGFDFVSKTRYFLPVIGVVGGEARIISGISVFG